MNYSRREILKQAALLTFLGSTTFSNMLANEIGAGNFRFIYQNAELREKFYPFLVNVFNLYPELKLHQLIQEISQQKVSDEDIYKEVQSKLSKIKPLLGDLTYALPALKLQKNVMYEQTKKLLGDVTRIEGYLEFGTTGRYLDRLNDKIKFHGETYFVHDKEASYSPIDLIERGQLSKPGKFFALNNYQSQILKHVKKSSLELVTVYIGFHHCPIPLREEFITSIRDAMKPNGKMIVRDHDAHDESMNRIVSLAHDVFNMGTKENWDYNKRELRHFYSLDYLSKMLSSYGFKSHGQKLYQKGDPTKNALMLFTKA